MKASEMYIPVSCDFVDQIEILATKRKEVEVVYHDVASEERILRTVIKSWETKKKVEYLITISDERIRLDRIKSIDGFTNEGSCAL